MKDPVYRYRNFFRRDARYLLIGFLSFVIIAIITVMIYVSNQTRAQPEIRMEETESIPEFVYIPPEDYQQTIIVSASKYNIRVGEPIVFHATRQTAPFLKVRYDSLPKDACWLIWLPPEYEPEVAANLAWYANPEDHLIFNDADRSDIWTREGAFWKPGTYEVKAHSADLCASGKGFWSNTIRFTVIQK